MNYETFWANFDGDLNALIAKKNEIQILLKIKIGNFILKNVLGNFNGDFNELFSHLFQK